jgi:hypothetical protein
MNEHGHDDREAAQSLDRFRARRSKASPGNRCQRCVAWQRNPNAFEEARVVLTEEHLREIR